MATTQRKSNESPKKPSPPPATTPEARENQVISLAMDLAERQIREGTASSQVINHFLKMGSPRERAERERLENENELLRKKIESMASAKRVEELYESALNAMRSYSGQQADKNFDD